MHIKPHFLTFSLYTIVTLYLLIPFFICLIFIYQVPNYVILSLKSSAWFMTVNMEYMLLLYIYMFLCFPPSNLSLFIVVYCLVLCRKIYRVACLKILVGCSSDSVKRCNQNWHTILSWRLCEQIVPCLRMGLLERKNK